MKNILKITIGAFVLGLFSSNVTAQDLPEAYSLTRVNTQPKFVALDLHLFSVDIEKYNTSLKTGGGLKGMFGKVYFEGGFELDYAQGLAHEMFSSGQGNSGKGESLLKDQMSRNAFGTVGFAFIDRKRQNDVHVTVKSVKKGDSYVNYYIDTDASDNLKYNAEIGYTQGFTWYNLDELEITGKNLITNEVETFTGGALHTYMNYGFVSVGVSRTVFYDVELKYKGKLHSNKGFSRIYSALLISTQMTFEDILLNTDNYSGSTIEQMPYHIDSYLKKNPVGFKVGYAYESLGKVGLGCTVETGVIPGTGGIGRNFYLSVGTRLSFTKLFN